MKRIISMLLVCILLLQAVPLTGFASDYDWCYFDTFAELKELASKTYTTHTYLNYDGSEDLVISENLTLPENTVLYAADAKIIVPGGVSFQTDQLVAGSLTVNGTARLSDRTEICDCLTVTGNLYADWSIMFRSEALPVDKNVDDVIIGIDKITFSEYAIIFFHPEIYTTEELRAYVEKASRLTDPNISFEVYLQSDFVLDQSVTIPEKCTLTTWLGNSLTVAAGCTLTIHSEVDIHCPTTVEGSLVNNGWFSIYDGGNLTIASGGKYSGKGYIVLRPDSNPADYITGVNLDDFTSEKHDGNYIKLSYVGGLTRLPAPTDLKWGKLEDFNTWSNSAGGYIQQDVTAPGGISFKINSEKTQRLNVAIYNSEDTLIAEYTYGRGGWDEWASDIRFIISDPASGSYYYTVTALGDNETYRNSKTVKSPTFNYTKPSKKVGSCTNVSWEQDGYPSFSAPSSATYVGGYEFEIYRAATKSGKQEHVGKQIYYDTKSVPDVSLITNLVNVFGAGYYSYRVRALSSDITVRANGAWSEMSNAIYLAPLNAKTSNVASSGKIKVTWEKVSGAAEYQVYRATSKSGAYKLMKTTTGTSYTNTSAEAGKTYYYKVRAVTKDGVKTPFSKVVSHTCDLPRPEVKTSNVASSGKIKVTWEKVSGASEYQVYRATSEDGEYKLMKTTTGTSYTNTSAEAGNKYYYKVKAIHSNSAANSADSEAVSRYCDLARPKVDSSNLSSTGKIKLTWGEVEGATEYQVYRATSEKGEYKLMKTTTGTSYTNTSATAGKKYYYKVKAIHSNSSCNSVYSEVESRYCDLARPDVSISLKSGDPRITWDKVSGAKEYYVYRATSASGEYKKVKTTTGSSYTDTSAKAGKTYYYKVKAVHSTSSANSAYSSVKSIKAK